MLNPFTGARQFGKYPSDQLASSAQPDKTWTGTTDGLWANLMNAPTNTTTWRDISGNNRHFTFFRNTTASPINGGYARYVTDNGGGIVFGNPIFNNGNNAQLAITNTYVNSTAWSIEMVVKPNATVFPATLASLETYSLSAGTWIRWTDSTTITIGPPPGTAINWYTLSSTPSSIQHIVVTANPLTSPYYKLYVNGTLQTAVSTGATGVSISSAPTAFMSRHNNNGTIGTPVDACAGTLYQARVYNNKILSDTEVSNNYTAVKNSVPGGYGLP